MRQGLEFLNSPIFSENVTRLTCFPTHAPFSSQGLGMWSSLTPLLFQLGLQSVASAEISSCVDLDEAPCGLGPFVVGIEACVPCAVTLSGCYFESQVHYLGRGGMSGQATVMCRPNISIGPCHNVNFVQKHTWNMGILSSWLIEVAYSPWTKT